MNLWLVLAVVVALLGVIVLACLAWCWDEPVRRGGQVVDLHRSGSCAHPNRCGSDGISCVHGDCYWYKHGSSRHAVRP